MLRPQFKPNNKLAEIIRVDHAGEYGAQRIYLGQLATLQENTARAEIEQMYNQELKHLEYFTEEIVNRQVRPTLLMPLWHIGGWLMGALTSACSTKKAMICTEAVEEVIDSHYQTQLNYLHSYSFETELTNNIQKFKAEELEHKDRAAEFSGTYSFSDKVAAKAIKLICHFAITLSKKI